MTYTTRIPNLDHTVVKPIVTQVLSKVRNDAYFRKDIPIVYIDHTGSANEVGSELSDKGNNDLNLESTSKIIARATETQYGERFTNSTVAPQELIPIWYDMELKMSIAPTRIRTEVVVELRYKAASKQECDNWINQYYRRLATGVTFTNMELAYEITVPEECIHIARAVWEAREKKAGYGDQFLDYLKSGFLTPSDLKTNIVGKGASLVSRQKLMNVVVGLSKEVPVATPIDGGNYEATIELKLHYDKPTTMVHSYPVFVHNSYINPKFIDTDRDMNERLIPQSVATTDYFKALTDLFGPKALLGTTGYVIPRFDPTAVNHQCSLIPFIQVQLAVSEEDPRLILDLSTMEVATKFKFNEDMLPYIKELGNDVFIYGRGAVCISVARDGVRLNPERYYLDSNMQVRADYNLNMRGNYHATISILGDVTILSRQEVELLAKYGSLAIGVCVFLRPDLINEIELPTKRDSIEATIPDSVDVDELYKALIKIGNSTDDDSTMRLVNTIVVSADHK